MVDSLLRVRNIVTYVKIFMTILKDSYYFLFIIEKIDF